MYIALGDGRLKASRRSAANAQRQQHFKRRPSRRGKLDFVLINPSGRMIGESRLYAHSGSCEVGIGSVMVNAATAALLDSTKT